MPEKLSTSDGSRQILNQVRDDACCEVVRRVREITPEKLPLMWFACQNASASRKAFANAGINVYGLLSDYTGKSAEDLKDMEITYEDLITKSQDPDGVVAKLKESMGR